MSRQATGQVVVRTGKKGRLFALRFRAYGVRRYERLGTTAEGWTPQRAELELQNVLAEVRRGVWRPSRSEPPPVPAPDPTFHEFASEWFDAHKRELRPSTARGYEGYLSSHLLPFFARYRLSEIGVRDVDRYRDWKMREADEIRAAAAAGRPVLLRGTDRQGRRYERPTRPLSPATINHTLKLLGQILDVAEERELLLRRNPMRINPRKRKVKASRPRPVWLDRAPQIEALLEAAGELDAAARADRKHVPRRPILATLTFAGLRIGELCDLRWRDADLAGGRLWVGRAKTDAGVRHVDLLPALRDELGAHRASHSKAASNAPVFASATGARMNERNIAQRVLVPAIARANELLDEQRHAPLPEGLTLHKLRHTCCSLLFVCGYELPRVMAMLGHADASTTLRVYAHVMAADHGDREQLRELVGHVQVPSDWAPLGTNPAFDHHLGPSDAS